MITQQAFTHYIADTYNILADHPWKGAPSNTVFRHPRNNKWFVLLVDITADKLGLENNEVIHIINVKLRPELIDVLVNHKNIFPAYHMNKEHWLTIVLDYTDSLADIEHLIQESYDLTQ